MLPELSRPFDGDLIMQSKRKLLRLLKERENGAVPLKIAVLGGSTTSDIVKVLELFLRDRGIAPSFYESEYAQYFNDAVFGNGELDGFKPEIVFIHTCSRNIEEKPVVGEDAQSVNAKLEREYARFERMWTALSERFGCVIVQNNFELPGERLLGNREVGCAYGRVDFITRLNCRLYDYAQSHKNFYIHDINYLSAAYGLERWHELRHWHLYKYAMSVSAIPEFAYSLASVICSVMGRNKKVLALDLDNTLWGGVIGDDGQSGIEIGSETSEGQSFLRLQKYIKAHKELGILLTVCSKNDPENALEGLNHPDGALRPDDFACIKANWDEKWRNLEETARELNLLPESFVFVDDNPAEREIVRTQLPEVTVIDFDNPEECIRALDKCGFFEVTALSADDAARGEMYRANAERAAAEKKFASYGEFLQSLEMRAEIRDFEPVHIPRITQLTNKSNQFNLTTKRYTQAEMESVAADGGYIRLCGRLVDKFGDNGIVSIVIGKKDGKRLHIELWLMSCRVLKREMELAMLDRLVGECRKAGITEIFGYYYPTKKNGMVAGLYEEFGFARVSEDNGRTVWSLDVEKYSPKTTAIKINESEN
ncbi:MAG: HAD-IIIC family phosphatase [Lachnospiraceae bacterium]|nr:HAD-IIIC family phosphatase [Ruminococcus sp.]MCM1273866.1 HAD-IIIC family phosphatase [Lachnospiraceae bacterium]